MNTDISIVIPVYNSAPILPWLTAETNDVLRAHFTKYQIIFVNDGSSDDSCTILTELCEEYSHIQFINLVRNQGQQAATLCGIRAAEGRFVVTMDDDGQHDPRDIPALVKALEAGADLSYAVPEHRAGGCIRRAGGNMRDVFFHFAFRKQKGLRLSSFRAMRSDLCDRIKLDDPAFPYISAMVFRYDIRAVNIPVQFRCRKEGRSGYHIFKLIWLYLRLIACYGPIRFPGGGKGGKQR